MLENSLNKVVVIIPSYRPPQSLPCFINGIKNSGFSNIIVIDDGSPEKYRGIFQELESITLLTNSENLGKGAALKIAYSYVLKSFCDAKFIISCDDDNQHSTNDIIAISNIALKTENPYIYLGSRNFGENVPLRSRVGNIFMKWLFKFITSSKIQDTQTGLRCIPVDALRYLITIRENRFDFEIISLFVLIKKGFRIIEIPIQTIYFNGNTSTRFKIVSDSFSVISGLLHCSLKK